MGNIILKTGRNRFRDDDYLYGGRGGWYVDTVSLNINYDKDYITFVEFNGGVTWHRGECRIDYSYDLIDHLDDGEGYEFDSYSCELATVNKKEFYWLINNIIDIIKKHKSKKKKSIEINPSPQIIIEFGKK